MLARAAAMLFFGSIDELVRAVERGRLQPRDQVFVPLAALRAVTDAHAEAAERAVLLVGAAFHPMPGLQRIAVLSLRELNEGLQPGASGAA